MKRVFIYILLHVGILVCSTTIGKQLLSNESYIAGDDGVIRMYVNIMGHVKYPGTFLVYDEIDFMSALSMAGGYLQGADLKNITIYCKNGSKKNIDLIKILNSESSINSIVDLNPHDTIYIEQKGLSKFFISSNLPTIILSLINVGISIKNSD